MEAISSSTAAEVAAFACASNAGSLVKKQTYTLAINQIDVSHDTWLWFALNLVLSLSVRLYTGIISQDNLKHALM